MAENTKIEWAHHTMNFWIGCTKVSPACDHCYAETLMDHRMHRVEWGGERARTSEANWRQPYRWNEAARKAGERRRVFTLSLGDFFDNQVDTGWRADAWKVIADCTHLDWLILTKRPQNIARKLPVGPWWDSNHAALAWPWPHVWLGCTAENQEEADRRIPALLAVPAARHFISAEPLLGPLDLSAFVGDAICASTWLDNHGVERCDITGKPCGGLVLVICGGESGAGARPMHPAWACALRDQCHAAGVPFFFKQWGEFSPEGHPDQAWMIREDGVAECRPTPPSVQATPTAGHSYVYRVGKRAAGRLIDGREWSGMPEG